MDYKTRPLSRRTIRRLSKYLRKAFGVSVEGPFPVMECLDKLKDVFKNCNYDVLEDNEFEKNVMARCVPNDFGGYTIEIRESVYEGAYKKRIGAYLGFICHEICHVFLFRIGYTPVFERSFKDNTINRSRSVEWQAKALCGETMVPFEESKGMGVERLMSYYRVSKGFADFRLKMDE
ncbi:MAG: ImmA/IrrE family metallo-endopeptidase [Lachnospiraceae bacterium]|nr:ImmA/IrrE family metallo-endopeptidase [Lachnospiraceae bacterium]